MSQHKAIRRLARKERLGQPITIGDALACCRFRTLLSRAAGFPAGQVSRADQVEALLRNVTAVIALIEPTPSPIDPKTMGEVQADLAAGRTVLLLASHREVRDHARAEILGWAGPARGAA